MSVPACEESSERGDGDSVGEDQGGFDLMLAVVTSLATAQFIREPVRAEGRPPRRQLPPFVAWQQWRLLLRGEH